MKNHTVVSALLAVLTAALSSCGSGGAAPFNAVSAEHEVITDEMFCNSEENAELVVMRVGDRYITYSKGGSLTGWAEMFNAVPPDGIALDDGGFGIIKADITRVTGGEGGYSGEPRIDTLISFSPMTFSEAKEYAAMKDYDPDETYFFEPKLCGGYYAVYIYPNYHVYRDGEVVGEYGSVPETQAAMGISELSDENVTIKDVRKETLTVMRVGDTYLSYDRSMSMNRYWTPMLDRYYRNEPTGFELADGEAAKITADISVLNGGDAGYVNVPLVRTVHEVRKCGYNDIIGCCEAMIPWFGSWESVGSGDSVAEYSTRIYLDQQPETYGGFEYFGGTWLIFWFGGAYRVYLDDGEPALYGIYRDSSEVDDMLTHYSTVMTG